MRASDLILVVIIVTVVLVIRWRSRRKSGELEQKAADLSQKQHRALNLLETEGFTVLEANPAVKVAVTVDGRPRDGSVTADFLVQKNGLKYVAEIKGGASGPKLTAGQLHRLLEYYLVYKPDGVLVVDLEKKKLKEYTFEIRTPADTRAGRRAGVYYLVAAGLGAGLFWLFTLLAGR